MWMWVVAFELEVFVLEIEDVLYVGIDLHGGQGTRVARQLQLGLFDVVQVEVRVACGVDEVTRTEARHLCHHLQQQGVGGDIKSLIMNWIL